MIVSGSTCYKANNIYRRNWLLSLEASKESYSKAIKTRAREVYRVKSLHDLGALESNDRRLKRRTPTKPLVASRVCKVYPPDVEGKRVYEKQRENSDYVFSCSDPTPTMYLNADLDESDVLCRVCGDIIRKPNLRKSVRYKECF